MKRLGSIQSHAAIFLFGLLSYLYDNTVLRLSYDTRMRAIYVNAKPVGGLSGLLGHHFVVHYDHQTEPF